MAENSLITNADIETAFGDLGRLIAAAPRLLLWLICCGLLYLRAGALVVGAVLAAIAVAWVALYSVPRTRTRAVWAWRHVGPAADLLRSWVGWVPGSKPDRQARRRGAAMVRNLAAAAREAVQSTKHTKPNGTERYTDPRGDSLEVTPLGVRLVARPTKRHTAEGLAKMQDAYASRLGIQAPERLTATVLDQARVAFDWEYLDPYEGTRLGAASRWDA